MDNEPLLTTPVSPESVWLREKFYETIAAQSEQMDKLGQQLIGLELAIPGLYATVLKLVHGDAAQLPNIGLLWLTFGCWFVALALTLISMIPRQWQVDLDIARQGPPTGGILGIEDYFYRSARYKRRLLIPSSVLLFAGVIGATWLIF